MQPQTRRILIWAVGAVVFSASLVGAAFLGIELARRDLPQSALEGKGNDYPLGVIVSVGGESDPVFLAGAVQPIRDFWFAEPTPEERAAANAEAAELRRIDETFDLRTLRQDADVMQIEILSGPARGETLWLHLSQLPENRP